MSIQFIVPKQQQSIEDIVQLCYVLPRENLNLLPMNVNILLIQKLSHLYGDDYEYVYKQWCKIWKKMDKYRIDSYMEKGMTYKDAVEKTEEYAKQFPLIEDKILNGI